MRCNRADRFQPTEQVTCLVKNKNARCSCFWLCVENISRSGICLGYHGLGCIPVTEKTVLSITLDLHSKVFRRPLHLKLEVIRIDQQVDGNSNDTYIATKIIEFDEFHDEVWSAGLKRLEESKKVVSNTSAVI